MNVFDIWNTITEFLKYLAPAVITFAIFYVGIFLINGYVKIIESIKFIFEKPGRVLFIMILFLIVWYFWEEFKVGLGW